MAYRDITFQGASVLWGTRAAERNAETRKRLEREHNVRIGDKVKIVTEEVSEEKERKSEKQQLLIYTKILSCCELKQERRTAFVNRLRGKNLKQ